MAEQVQDTSAQDQQVEVVNRIRGYDFLREMDAEDYGIWHHLIFCEELENDGENGAFCWVCEKAVLRGPAYKCLECDFLQHQSCVDRPHGLAIEIDHIDRLWQRHHLIFIEEDLHDNINGGEESKNVVCSGCKEPTIGEGAYKCSMPRCTFLLHKSCGELHTRIKHPMHDPDHILLLQEPSMDHKDCYVCRKDFSGSLFYSCTKDCRFNLHATCAPLSRVNADDCQQHKLLPSRKQVQFTCESCGVETKDIAYLCSECRVLIHGECALFPHTINTSRHDHSLIRTYSLSHQLDELCKLCYKKFNNAAYYCWECGYVAHLYCAIKISTTELVASNSIDYLTHLVHLVEGINLANDERASPPEIQHFSHPQHNLILSNEEPINDMHCEACMQFIISNAPFYGCTQCNFFLHNRCARLPSTIKRGIFHKHSLTLLSQAPTRNGLFECTACKRIRHGFTYSCSECRYNLDVQCCLIPETLKHEGHRHSLFLAIRFSETCHACSEDCADSVRFVCTDCNFTLCIRCATLPLVAKCQYDTHLLIKLSYTRENASKEYYCLICEEERDHPDHWFYYCVECKFTAHSRCVLGKNPYIKFGSTYIHKRHKHPLTVVQKTRHSPPCDSCGKPFHELDGVALTCTRCKVNVHIPFNWHNPFCLLRMMYEYDEKERV